MPSLQGGAHRPRFLHRLRRPEDSSASTEDAPHTTEDPRGSPSLPDIDELWNSALDEYRSSLNIDLNDPSLSFVRDLERCGNSEEILDALQDASECFSDRRLGSKASRALRTALKPVVHGLSVILDASAETVTSLGVPGGKGIFAAVAVLLRAADRVTATYDDLKKLFDRLSVYVRRLQVRVEVPMRVEAKRIAVQALIEMLKALELATKMMQRGRARQFVHALLSKSDGVQSALERLEDVTTEEERMAIAELVVGMNSLSSQVQQVSATSLKVVQVVHGVQPAIERTDITTRDILAQTTHISARVETLSDSFRAFVERSIPYDHSSAVITTQQEDSPACTGSSLLVTRRQGSRVRRLSNMGGDILRVISNFNFTNQDIVWRGLAAILSTAIDAVSSTGGCSVIQTTTSPSSLAVDVMELFIRLSCVFLLLFMIWQQRFVLRPLTRPPDTVIIVDVLGEVFVLGSDTFSTWENTHAFLLQVFQGRSGISYVRKQAYRLGDSDHVRIEPREWIHAVQPGAKLRMSIIVRDRSPRCPYCRHVTVPDGKNVISGDNIICSHETCGRQYSTYRRNDVTAPIQEPAGLGSEHYEITSAAMPSTKQRANSGNTTSSMIRLMGFMQQPYSLGPYLAPNIFSTPEISSAALQGQPSSQRSHAMLSERDGTEEPLGQFERIMVEIEEQRLPPLQISGSSTLSDPMQSTATLTPMAEPLKQGHLPQAAGHDWTTEVQCQVWQYEQVAKFLNAQGKGQTTAIPAARPSQPLGRPSNFHNTIANGENRYSVINALAVNIGMATTIAYGEPVPCVSEGYGSTSATVMHIPQSIEVPFVEHHGRPHPNECRLRGCHKHPAYMNTLGGMIEWCSYEHMHLGVQQKDSKPCKFCRIYPRRYNNNYCCNACAAQ